MLSGAHGSWPLQQRKQVIVHLPHMYPPSCSVLTVVGLFNALEQIHALIGRFFTGDVISMFSLALE